MPPDLPVVRVESDRRNAGKTWLAAALIGELTRRGYRVGAVKHSHHPTPPDKAGSDTELFARAGAARVVFDASNGVVERAPVPLSLVEAIANLRGDVDVAIVEGFRGDEVGARLHIDAVSGNAALTSMDGRHLATAGRDAATTFADAIERAFELSAAGSDELRRLVRRAAAAHGHLCPGVILGVRMTLAATCALGMPIPAPHRSLEVTVETARCAADAIASASGCSVGRGTLRLEEHGALAARFLDRSSGAAVRVAAREEARSLAAAWAPHDYTRRHAQSVAYRLMPDELLLDFKRVQIAAPAIAGEVRLAAPDAAAG